MRKHFHFALQTHTGLYDSLSPEGLNPPPAFSPPRDIFQYALETMQKNNSLFWNLRLYLSQRVQKRKLRIYRVGPSPFCLSSLLVVSFFCQQILEFMVVRAFVSWDFVELFAQEKNKCSKERKALDEKACKVIPKSLFVSCLTSAPWSESQELICIYIRIGLDQRHWKNYVIMHFKKSTLSFHYTFKIVFLWQEWKQGGNKWNSTNITHAIHITWPKMFLDIFKLSLYWIYVEENSPNLPNLRDVKIDFWFCVVWEWNKYRRRTTNDAQIWRWHVCPNIVCVCTFWCVKLSF